MANETANTQPGVLDTVNQWMTSVGQIFNTGLGLYTAADQRLEALNSIKEDTVQPTSPKQPTVVSGKTSLPSWVIPAGIGLGVLLLIVLVRKLR